MADLSVESICERLKKVPVEDWKEASVSGKRAYHADVSGMRFCVNYKKTETPFPI